MQRDVVPRSLKAFSPELSPVFTGVTPVLFLVLSLSVSFFLPFFFFFFSLFSLVMYNVTGIPVWTLVGIVARCLEWGVGIMGLVFQRSGGKQVKGLTTERQQNWLFCV